MKLDFLKEPLPRDVTVKNLQWKFLIARTSKSRLLKLERSRKRQTTKDLTILSRHGDQVWKIGKWYEVKGNIRLCNNGFHSSPTVKAAKSYIPHGTVLALVEWGGESLSNRELQKANPYSYFPGMGGRSKRVSQRMRIVAAWLTTPEFLSKIHYSDLWGGGYTEKELRAQILNLVEFKRPRRK